MLNHIESIGIFQVRVGNRIKFVKGPLRNYIKIEHYDSLATYINANKRTLKKQGLDTVALCLNENYFEANKKKFVHPKFCIPFDHILDNCWIVTSYSKNATIRIFTKPPIFVQQKAIDYINEILLDYGVRDKVPKYFIERFENDVYTEIK